MQHFNSNYLSFSCTLCSVKYPSKADSCMVLWTTLFLSTALPVWCLKSCFTNQHKPSSTGQYSRHCATSIRKTMELKAKPTPTSNCDYLLTKSVPGSGHLYTKRSFLDLSSNSILHSLQSFICFTYHTEMPRKCVCGATMYKTGVCFEEKLSLEQITR